MGISFLKVMELEKYRPIWKLIKVLYSMLMNIMLLGRILAVDDEGDAVLRR